MKNLTGIRSLLFAVLISYVGINISSAQIVNGLDTLLGNEWIDYSQSYYKMMLAEDGVYRVSYDELKNAGIPVESVTGAELQVYYFGEEQSINVSTNGLLTSGDFIEFVGVKNRGELDKHLYNIEDDQLNPKYSLYTDTSAYFITWDQGVQGKRFETEQIDLTGNMLAPEPYYIHEDELVFAESLIKPTFENSVRYSQFMNGEGYSSKLSKVTTFNHSVNNYLTGFENPTLDLRISGNNNIHNIDISVDGNQKQTVEFSGNVTKQYNIILDDSDIANSTVVRLQSNTSPSETNAVAYSVLSYPKAFDFENKNEYEFNLKASTQNRYIEISNFDIGAGDVKIIDIDSKIIYTPVIDNDLVKIIIPASNSKQTFKIYTQDAIKSINSIKASAMVDYSAMQDIDYIMYSSHRLDKQYDDGVNYLRAYADHRASENGGSYTPAIVFVEDLYNQFGYGINRNPISIKNHALWVSDNWTKAKYNFLIGKGIEYSSSRTATQIYDAEDPLRLGFFVPTFGLPGSDNLLLAKKNESQPLLPTGRVSASNLKDIKSYYDKVVKREDPTQYPSTIEGRLWTKNLLHLAGGDKNIQEQIETSLENMGEILVQSRFGADVTTFAKQSSDAISTDLSSKLLSKINEGVSILSFFGHSSSGTFDFSLDEASQYDNEGRLPILLSMGCYSGNIHTPYESISENFVLEPNVGSIAFMASSGSAYITPQGKLGERYYQAVATDYYQSSVGEIVWHLLELYKDLPDSDKPNKSLNQQFTLHGDPAVKTITFIDPDYTIDYSSITADPTIIAPENIEFEVYYDVVNLGENIPDSINIRAIQYLPDGSAFDTVYNRIKAPTNRTKEKLLFKNPGLAGIGESCITIELNYDNEIIENPTPDAITNNVFGYDGGATQFCYFSLDNSAIPVYPENYAIVNGQQPILIASTSNVLATDNTYYMELDTTALFNSNAKKSITLNKTGGSLRWDPETQFVPGTVYYWRVSPDSTNVDIGYQWKNSSFIYLPNSSDGWNQSHYYQFLDNNLEGIDYENRKLDYINEALSVFTDLKLPAGALLPRWYQDDFPIAYFNSWNYSGNGIAVAFRDDKIAEFELNKSPGLYGSYYNSSSRRLYIYPTDNQESRIALVNMLEDVIQEGHHVIVYTVINKFDADLHTEEWAQDSIVNQGRNFFNVLEKQGATKVRQLEDLGTVFWGLIYDKDKLFRDENIGSTVFDNVHLETVYQRNYIEGDLNTYDIGPALSWDKMIWNVEGQSPVDTFMCYIKGMKKNGDMDTLFTVSNENEVDLSGVDANVYPNLRLDLYTKDKVDKTPININFWRVLFEAAPEAILSKDDSFVFNSDTLQQGQLMEFAIKAENISRKNMDSLLVKYTITDPNNIANIKYERLAPLKSNEELFLNFTYDTKTSVGKHQFNFEINPEEDQPEKFYFNNFGVKEFYVQTDDKNPVLDVSFDGVHIINGDIVAANPFILVEIKDENEFLLLNDPEKFELALIDPSGNRTDYTVASPELTFEPATDGNNNKAKISLEPLLTEDGDYRLIVQATDMSNNNSGDNDYEVTFKVILKESVSNVLNYPNPFSTKTQFIFTLTGSEVPDDISISILTVSGKVVKEISKEEMGPLRIGINRTDYWWNGTDDYGEKLANGVYLYKVNLPADTERYKTNADQYFTNGFGKLVIMR